MPGPPSVVAAFGIKPDGRPGAAILPLAVAAIALASTVPATAGLLIPIACVFILLIGLPHGMFDYLTLRKMDSGSRTRLVLVTAAYLGVATAVWLSWQSASFLTLGEFIAVAMFHFSEDWINEQSRLGAAAMAISMIAMPALFYPAELSALFALIGGPGAGVMADYLRLVAPVFGLVAAANVMIEFSSDAADRGWRNAVLLLAALILPPGIGFAVYFCLYHSPIHFAEGRRELIVERRSPEHFFFYMSLATAAVLSVIIVAQPFEALDSRLIAATFQTLSVLTVPHMLLPFFAAKMVKSRPG